MTYQLRPHQAVQSFLVLSSDDETCGIPSTNPVNRCRLLALSWTVTPEVLSRSISRSSFCRNTHSCFWDLNSRLDV